jgi:hypothetical protein
MSGLENSDRPLWVDERPSVELNMRLLFLSRGAIHGYH